MVGKSSGGKPSGGKGGGGMGLLWMATRKKSHTKHKDKYYRSHSRDNRREKDKEDEHEDTGFTGSPRSKRKHSTSTEHEPGMAGDARTATAAPVAVGAGTVASATGKDSGDKEQPVDGLALVETSVAVELDKQNGGPAPVKPITEDSPRTLNSLNRVGSKELLERKREEEAIEMAEDPATKPKHNEVHVIVKSNGHLDHLDGAAAEGENETRKWNEPEKEKEEWGIKCLYYTLQCCECVIS